MISLTEYLDVARKVTLENGGSLVSVFGSATLFVCCLFVWCCLLFDTNTPAKQIAEHIAQCKAVSCL